jgi:hypothetical protein
VVRGENDRKITKVASGVAVFLVIRWEQFSCSTEMQHALIFWPLHLLVLRAMAMPCPVRLCAIEDRRHGFPNLCREGVRWYNDRYPRRCRGMDVVMVE